MGIVFEYSGSLVSVLQKLRLLFMAKLTKHFTVGHSGELTKMKTNKFSQMFESKNPRISGGYGLINYPMLYGRTKAGKLKQWSIEVERINGDYRGMSFGRITVSHGLVAGKISHKVTMIKFGKNIGKKNETLPFTQAVLNAASKWRKQIDKGYTEDESGISNVELPMKAKNFREVPHFIVYPAIAQKKLNGVRVWAEKVDRETMKYTSNGGKIWTTLHHWDDELLPLMSIGSRLDGEAYVHGWTFQRIARAIKKQRTDSLKLQFHVFDIVDLETPDRLRQIIVDNLLWGTHYKHIKRVNPYSVHAPADIKRLHDEFVEQGYEGIILRNLEGLYLFSRGGIRSSDLLKYKEFEDAEFKIVDAAYESLFEDGIELKCVIFIVETEKGQPFKVVPKGSKKRRAQWYMQLESLIGKPLKVRYFELSEDGIPMGNPVGLDIRDYE